MRVLLLEGNGRNDGVEMGAILGRVPEAGEAFNVEGFRVVIERVVKRRIERVYFERVEQMSERVS